MLVLTSSLVGLIAILRYGSMGTPKNVAAFVWHTSIEIHEGITEAKSKRVESPQQVENTLDLPETSGIDTFSGSNSRSSLPDPRLEAEAMPPPPEESYMNRG